MTLSDKSLFWRLLLSIRISLIQQVNVELNCFLSYSLPCQYNERDDLVVIDGSFIDYFFCAGLNAGCLKKTLLRFSFECNFGLFLGGNSTVTFSTCLLEV